MNRILLIGNGFDLAHGLKTGYNDFIVWFWMEQFKKINDTKFLEWEPVSRGSETTHYIHRNNRYFDVKFIGTKNQLNECCKQEETKPDIKITRRTSFSLIAGGVCVSGDGINDGDLLVIDKLNETGSGQDDIYTDQEEKKSKPHKSEVKLKYETPDILKDNVVYKNKFLELIEQRKRLKNWVDLEELYFEILTGCKNRLKQGESAYEIYTIGQLNNEFDYIKEELVKFFKLRNIVLKENAGFTTQLKNGIVKEINEKIDTYPNVNGAITEENPVETALFLNFNYTETVSDLYNIDNKKRIMYQIHGRADNAEEEEIIVGYGDEKSDHSPDIEKLNDNAFLENEKSIKYVEAEHYANLLRFIEKDYYDVFVFGHSCGNSDRTLLKKLFENDHCKEVRCFYHKDKSGHEDFQTTIDNIYRKFDEKNSFRLKIRKRDKVQDVFPQYEGEIPTELVNKIIRPQEAVSLPDATKPKELHAIQKKQAYLEKYAMVEIKVDEECNAYKKIDDRITSKKYLKNPFRISSYQLTQEQWKEIMEENPSWFHKNGKGKEAIENINTDKFPVESVPWYECVLFCNMLSEMYGLTKYYNINGSDVTFNGGARGFRLPTEAEWEYAARGGIKSKNCKYSGSNTLDEVGWYYENSGNEKLSEREWNIETLQKAKCQTHEVGTKQGNELDIHDMSGNVWEWCEDWYTPGAVRVLRGGSWYNSAGYCAVSYRDCSTPGRRCHDVGFRLVLPQ